MRFFSRSYREDACSRSYFLAASCVLLASTLTISCRGRIGNNPHIQWTPIDSLNSRLPASVRVYSGVDVQWPLRAWYVKADLASPTVHAHVVMSDDSDARETTSSFAHDLGACVVVNGGYFRTDLDPARAIGLLMIDSVLVSRPTPSVIRENVRYRVTRAALGFDSHGQADIGWISMSDSALIEWPHPLANRPAAPADSVSRGQGHVWRVVDAVAAGPALISDGKINVTGDEEVFFGSAIPKVHPRTAAGITKNGTLILLVVDGRQIESAGVNLENLASILLNLGAFEAMNLDGGGSSTIAVDGTLLNVPAGSEREREVMSAVALDCSSGS